MVRETLPTSKSPKGVEEQWEQTCAALIEEKKLLVITIMGINHNNWDFK